MSELAQTLAWLREERAMQEWLIAYARTHERRAWFGMRLGVLDDAMRIHASVLIGAGL